MIQFRKDGGNYTIINEQSTVLRHRKPLTQVYRLSDANESLITKKVETRMLLCIFVSEDDWFES